MKFYNLILILLLGSWSAIAQPTYVANDESRYFRQALELYQRQQYISAQAGFEQYLQSIGKDPTLQTHQELSIEAHYYQALCALKLKSEDADALLDRFVRAYPNHPKATTAYYDWANQYYADQDYAKAAEYFRQVVSANPKGEQANEAKYKMAMAYYQQKKYNEAQANFDDLKLGNSQYATPASFYAGFLAYRENNLNPALRDLQKAEKSAQFAPRVPVMIADILYQQQKYEEVIKYTLPLLNGNKNLEQVADIHLLTADSYFFQNDFKNALSYYKQYIGLLNREPDKGVLYRLGYALYQNESYNEATENLKKVASDNTIQGQSAAYYLGLSYLRLGNKQFAITALEQARLSNFDQNIRQEADYTLGKLYYDTERYDEAITALQAFTKNYPQHPARPQALDLLSKAYLHSNKYDEALAYIEDLPQKSNAIKAAYQQISFSKGIEFFNNNQYPQAIAMFQKSINNSQNADLEGVTKYWLGESYLLSDNPKAAIPYYQQILDVQANLPKYALQAHYSLGYAYFNTQQFAMAIPHFQMYVTQIQNQADRKYYEDAMMRLADCYFAQRNYTDALRFYEQFINTNQLDKDYACYQRALILQTLNRPAEAKASLEIISSQFPNSLYFDQALYQKGVIDLETASFAVAISQFTQLINTKPTSPLIPDALLKRGLAYKNLSNNSAAIADYRTLVNDYTTHPNASSALFGLQELLANEGRDGEFATLLEKFRTANPNSQASEKIYFENAKNAYFNQQYQVAINSFNQYLSNYPQSAYAYDSKFYLGESYFRLADNQNALKLHRQVVQERKSAFLARSARRAADLELANQQFAQATTFYRVLANSTDSKREQMNAFTGLLECYYQLNKPDSLNYFADAILNQANVAGAKNTALLYKAKVSYRQARYEIALPALQNLANTVSDESGAEAQYLVGDIYFKQKNYKKSLETLFELNKKFTQYEKWRGRGFLLIADNYLAQGETFQAKATLQSLIDKSPDAEVVNLAKQKLVGIK
jgi:TolA-binding protein